MGEMRRVNLKSSDPVLNEKIPDKNLFMICRELKLDALRELPEKYHIRNCQRDELDIWKAFPFDDATQAEVHRGYMTSYFDNVYAPKGDLFYRRCLFVCDNRNVPIATGFIWKAYNEFNTIHWLKVLKHHEGGGIGRGLLSIILGRLLGTDFPVYLHTQPSSYRAVKLYSDFGFAFLTDPVVGTRTNDLEECLPILKHCMPDGVFGRLRFTRAPEGFLNIMEAEEFCQF